MLKIMKDMWRVLGPFLFIATISCSTGPEQGIKVFSVHSDLSLGPDGWEGEFTGYPATWEDSIKYELEFDYTNLPANLGTGKAIMLSGKNINGKLFMFIKNKVTGLAPNTNYSLVFEVKAASNAPFENDGTNGSPGTDVFLKAGASTVEPLKVIHDGDCELNLDKGSMQSLPGADMIVLGNIAVQPNGYNYIIRGNLNYNAPFIARTNSNGELWLIIGTDSAYTGLTTIYYSQIDVIFTVPN